MSFGFFPDMGSTGTIVRRQLITSNGTWNRPAGMVGTTVWLTMIGGGGSGNVSTTATFLMGGDGGQYVVRRSINIGATTSVNCTIGQGGAPVLNPGAETLGNPGSATSFGAFLSVSGGRGGFASATPTGGAVGRRNISGSQQFAQSVPGIFGGPGGATDRERQGGHGGGGLNLDQANVRGGDGQGGNAGNGGSGYGAGGGSSTNSVNSTSGAGAPGAILVEWLEAIS